MRRHTMVWSCALMFVVLASTACQSPDASALVSLTPLPTAAPHATTEQATVVPSRITPTSIRSTTATLTSPSPTATDIPTPAPSASPTPLAAAKLIHPRLMRTIGVGAGKALALAPNGRYLAVATTIGWGLYALPDLHEVRFEVLSGGVNMLRWSANSERLMVIPDQSSIITYRIPDGAGVQRRQNGASPVLSADGTRLALLQYPDLSGYKIAPRILPPASVVFMNTDTGMPFGAPISIDYSYRGMLTFSPDNKVFAAELNDSTEVWQNDDGLGKSLNRTLALVAGIQPVFSPNGQFMATTFISATATEVRLWRMPSGQPLARLVIGPASYGPAEIAIQDDGAVVEVIPDPRPKDWMGAVGYTSRQVQIWDSLHEKLRHTSTISATGALFGPGGRVLMAHQDNNDDLGRGIRFIRVADGHVLYQDEQTSIADGQEPERVSWSADGTTAAYLADDGPVRLLDLVHGTTRELAFLAPRSVTFSPDGQMLAAVQNQSAVDIWRIDDPAFMRQFLPPKPSQANRRRFLSRVSFTPDGRALVAQASDVAEQVDNYAAIRWELADAQRGRAVGTLKTTSTDGIPMYLGPSDGPLYSQATNTFVWFDASSLRLQWDSGVLSSIPLTSGVASMALSPDGRRLAIYNTAEGLDPNDDRLELFALEPPRVKLLQSISLRSSFARSPMGFSSDGALIGIPKSGPGGYIWCPDIGALVPFGNALNSGGSIFSNGLLITSNDRLVIMAGIGEVRFYHFGDGLATHTYPIIVEQVGSIAINADEIAVSPAGDRLAVLSAGRITLWDIGS